MITLTLDDGRALGIDPVAPHEAMRLAEGCRNLSGVRSWWRTAMVVAAIRTIDGIPLPAATHEKHIEGLVARFSRAQFKTIAEAVDSAPEPEESPELELSELTPLETLRIWAIIGEFESVPGWVAPAHIAAAVRKINGVAVSFPTSRDDLRGLVQNLGLPGMTKASVFMLAQAVAEKESAADRAAAAKN